MTNTERIEGRVLRAVGGSYQVEVAGGDTLDCRLRGRVKRERQLGRVVAGDRVEVERLADGDCAVTGVLPRSSVISRRAAHGHREQVIVANVDQLAAVCSVAEPAPQFDLLDRFLVLAESSEIAKLIVVNKIDRVDEAAAREQFATYDRADYEILYTSAMTQVGIEQLGARLKDQVTVLIGASGVGKSSLLNALQPELGLRIGAISRAVEAGRHTTVEASLHPLEIGGYVADTPGLRRLELWEVAGEELDACFPEFRPHLGECRFLDCAHVHEPGCAVRSALEEGAIDERRYASYVRMLEERRAQSPGY